MYLIPVPAFADSCRWLLPDGKRAVVVDPGDAEPVLRTLAQHGLQLESILVTHHDADDARGVDALRQASDAGVLGPAAGPILQPLSRFTRAVEPDNADLVACQASCLYLPDDRQPNLPTSIAQELLVNPFLQNRQAPVMAAARRFDASAHDDNTVFAATRQWKNQFK